MADEQTQQTPDEAADAALLRSEEIADRVAWVWGRVHRIPKTGKHPSQGYMFATESDIADHIRALCAEAGIVIRQRLIRHREEQVGTTKNGAPIFRHNVRVGYTVCCGKQEWPEQAWKGSADDSSDKGLAKALTACRKTYLIAMFQVSSGDDPDGQESPEIARGRERRTGPPRGRGQDQPYTPAPTAQALPVTKEQAARGRVLRDLLAGVHEEGEDGVRRYIANVAEKRIGREVKDLNANEFDVLLSYLEEKAKELIPGLVIDAETGEVKVPEAQESKPTAEPAPAPAEVPQPAEPAPVPEEQQQAIEEAAAEAKAELEKGADPDNPPLSGYQQAVEMARVAGMEQGALVSLMIDVGAAKESDLDKPDVWRAFLAAFETATA